MRTFLMSLGVVLVAASVQAADIKGSKDHPLLPRYDGSEILRYKQEAFTDYKLATALIKNYGGKDKNANSVTPLEGKFTQIAYKMPEGRSSLEVFRNYEQALKKAGFETMFSCERETCGGRNFSLAIAGDPLYMLFGDQQADQRYVAARLKRAEGDVYASLYVIMHRSGGGPLKDRALALLEITEAKPMEERMVVVESSAMQRDIASQGRVAIHGILFDFDKDTMRSDSKPQLDEIAKLLKAQPELKVLIVGHTDSKGALDYNRDLSYRRARSIVESLSREHGVAAARLTPLGVGMAAPMATNRTEEGRALNRRVELVDATN
ncbi:OmpA/MotB [Nitrobacter winogradskyi Nb-255]|uniref:OmpA/MotB n=1 Tax=Nitrobacter winogradskyi (strain ATCC 25391 / DSM 10237 / CIP 104748 / NCIMB 11846 / Nb-255) TaxID=323098 RepID=Q3SRL6_NITWN|nr:OmpA family protein [Nitrobacter winogradskyi]ABA05075.1 OmpA/MotB [Nitrobacter winogradskyi Nb-255]